MLQVKSSIVNTQLGGEALDVIAKTSMTSVDCTNVVSPTFITCTDSYSVSEDSSATGTGSQASISFTGAFVNTGADDYRINDAWTTTNLKTKGWNDTDIASAFYYVASGVVITLQPIDTTVTEPATFTLTSTATDATSSQWYKDSILIPGETGNDLVFNPSAVVDSGDYFNKFTDGTTPVDTNTVTVTVNAAGGFHVSWAINSNIMIQ